MNRISIDVTPEQHKRLKALAALQGKTIKQFVLERTLGPEVEVSLAELEAFLDRRRLEAEASPRTARTVRDVFAAARDAVAVKKPGA